jgi:hypothetical protein
MYVAVVTTLQAIVESLGLAGLPPKLQLLIAKIAQIYAILPIQRQTTRGKTARRNELLDTMVDTALEVANAVAIHANEHKLIELAKAVDVSAPQFSRMRIPDRPILAQQIHDTAQSVLPQLEPYGVTAENLTALQAQIELAKAWLDQPRTVIRSKAAATAQLSEVFDEIDDLLEGQIDRLMFTVRKTNPEVYADYHRARQIVATAGGHGADEPTAESAVADGGPGPTVSPASTTQAAA